MDVIPFARFFLALIGSGIMMYIFSNCIDMVKYQFPESVGNPYYTIINMIWVGFLIIILLREAMVMLRSLQRRRGIA